jgi:hypothetical protein
VVETGLQSTKARKGFHGMNGEVIYFCLMLLGWVFLVGWALALVAACAVVFREQATDDGVRAYGHAVAFKKADPRLT